MRNYRRIVIPPLGGAFFLALLLVLFIEIIANYDQISDWFAVQQSLAEFSDAKARFDIELARILDSAEDDLLIEREAEPLQVSPNCIRATTEWNYGTQRPFDNVLLSYQYVLEDERWRLAYQDNRTAVYRTPTMGLRIELQDAEQGYQTIYLVQFHYAEPSIEYCWE